MKPLIYYPTFEPPSELWLKFSMLYFENFKPIVPYNRRHLLSRDFRFIQNETDLITICTPEYNDGYRASLYAIEEVKKIMETPYNRSMLFNEPNILRKWNNQSNWDYLIYEEKFSFEWSNFCVENNLGRKVNDGILLSEELAFLFMTYLAKELAFRESAAIITDNNRFDNFTNYARGTNATLNNRTKFAKGLFNILVPQNLSDIPIERLVDFRNRNKQLITAFNKELDNVQDKIGEGYTCRDFIDSYNNIYSEFSREVLLLGIGIASIPLAAYMLISNKTATSPEYVHEILGALGIILGGGYSLNKGLRDMHDQRYCKKYLINLERLK